MYVSWGLIVKVSKVRHDCGRETLINIQNPAPDLPLSPTPDQCSSLYVLRRLTLSHVSVVSDKGQLQTKLRNVCVHEGLSFIKSTEENPVTVTEPPLAELARFGGVDLFRLLQLQARTQDFRKEGTRLEGGPIHFSRSPFTPSKGPFMSRKGPHHITEGYPA